jgi:FG-GAP repeat
MMATDQGHTHCQSGRRGRGRGGDGHRGRGSTGLPVRAPHRKRNRQGGGRRAPPLVSGGTTDKKSCRSCYAPDGDYATAAATCVAMLVGLDAAAQSPVRDLAESRLSQAAILVGDNRLGFGSSLAVERDLIVVGSPTADDRGAAYVFTRDGGITEP